MTGKVVPGFQRGSKQLGVPTANLEMTDENISLTNDVVPGVYMGTCELNGKTFQTAVSIGWNPCYDNAMKTVEAYLLGGQIADFYSTDISLQLNHYLRAEALYPSFDALLIAISCDIKCTEELVKL
jgi:FAD synthase